MTEGNDDKNKDETDITETNDEKENGEEKKQDETEQTDETNNEKENNEVQKQQETEQKGDKAIEVEAEPEEGNEKKEETGSEKTEENITEDTENKCEVNKGETTEEKKEEKKQLPRCDQYLSFLDFNPELLGRDPQSGIIVFERFDLVLKKANQWLKKYTEYKLKKVQSVDVAVPYTSLNLNANTAATDYYIDQGNKFYSRSLRLWLLPRIGDEPKDVQQIGYFNIIPEIRRYPRYEEPEPIPEEEPPAEHQQEEGNTEGAKREQEGEHREDKKEETKIETTSVDQYNEDEKKLMEEIQDSQNGGGCFVEDEKGDGNGQEKQEGAQQEEDGSENKAIDDDKDTAKEDDSDYNNTTRTEHDGNDDKDSGIGNENKEDGTNSGRSSAKNSENSKSIRDFSVSDMNKANIRRGSEIPIATKDEYENLEEALERFNTILLDQPIEGTVLNLETLQTAGKNQRSLLDVDSGIIQKTGKVIKLQFLRVWFVEDSNPITNLGLILTELDELASESLEKHRSIDTFVVTGIKDFVPTKETSDFSSVFKKLSSWMTSRLFINILNIESMVVPTNSEHKKFRSMETYENGQDEKQKNVTVIRVYYANKTIEENEEVSSKPAVVTYSTFLPQQLTRGRYPRHEDMNKLMEKARTWLKATGAEVICAETSAVRMADKPVKTKDTEITCGPSTSVLIADQLSHHFIFYLRLYLLGTYKEPKKKELEADASKNNTEKRAQSKTGNTQKPANQHNSSTCIIL